jgi:exopolyphosphatase/guanosine-5'-triphosphate,3'-diphosphate pyrophosphatase
VRGAPGGESEDGGAEAQRAAQVLEKSKTRASADAAGERAWASERQAVVDIGSNSVRLVIYDGPRRAPAQIWNEKALCGLGRDIGPDGRLDPMAVDYALATIRRFRGLLNEHGDPPSRVIATSAVREASDGKAFVEAVEKLGFKVSVVDGGEEAQLAALGVISCEPGAAGIVGDMGGGSLELVAVKDGAVGDNASLAIGPLRLIQQSGGKIGMAADQINKALDSLPWLNKGGYQSLYSVGGAWRAIGRIHMLKRRYPLSVLHHYEFSRADALSVCDLVAKQTPRSLQEISGIPRRRLDTLPFAALVLRSVLERTGVKSVMISAGGIREGLLYRDLSDEERAIDPLLAGARFCADKHSPEPDFGDAVAALIAPLFADQSPAAARVVRAASILVDIGAFSQPDLRAKQAFDTAVSAQLYGLSHGERVSIALALFVRHEGRRPTSADYAEMLGLLSPEDQDRATRLGLAMRFAADLAPKAPGAFAGCTLTRAGGKIEFKAPKERQALMGELPRKRLEALAAAFDAQAVEVYY